MTSGSMAASSPHATTYPVDVLVAPALTHRNRLTTAFRVFLAIPHLMLVGGPAAWVSILFTGAYPLPLYRFAVNVFRWTTRVEAYVLLLRDEYPPFSFE